MKKFFELSSWRTALGNLLPSAHGHQGGSRKAIGSMFIMAFAFVGCDDSSSASAGQNDEPAVESSSSSSGKVTEPAEVTSSSSEKAKQSNSSSSVGPVSSSNLQSDKKSSSSGVKDTSSSSLKSESSSSVGDSQSSSSSSTNVRSSSGETESSSSSVSELSSSSLNDFDWNEPKETYLNPEIEYDTIIDSRDGKVYKTVKIGEQVWMAENLNYYDASDLSVKEKSWCFGTSDNKDSATCDVTGRLYTWAAAIDSVTLATDTERPRICGFDEECSLPDTVQGICPLGWHLPNKEEWKNLLTTIGGSETAGDMLKTTSGWINSWESTDAFGFSALPAGYRICEGDYCYFDLGFETYFWSSTGYFDDHAYYINLRHYSRYSILTYRQKYYAFSVRCVKD